MFLAFKIYYIQYQKLCGWRYPPTQFCHLIHTNWIWYISNWIWYNIKLLMGMNASRMESCLIQTNLIQYQTSFRLAPVRTWDKFTVVVLYISLRLYLRTDSKTNKRRKNKKRNYHYYHYCNGCLRSLSNTLLFKESFPNDQEANQEDLKKWVQYLLQLLLFSFSSPLIVSQELFGSVIWKDVWEQSCFQTAFRTTGKHIPILKINGQQR